MAQKNHTVIVYGLKFFFMAGLAGLEPVTSAVTGQRSNQLSYRPNMIILVAGPRFERESLGYEPSKLPLLHPAVLLFTNIALVFFFKLSNNLPIGVFYFYN